MMRIKEYVISFVLSLIATTFGGSVFAESYVPPEYYANHHIAQERGRLLDLVIDLDASWKVGAEVPESTFSELYDIFDTIFEFFPSDPNSELVYRKCLLVTDELRDEVSRNDYAKFREQCFTPISDVLDKISSKFTVKPSIEVKPKQGNAPLNVTLDARASKDPSNDTIPSQNYFRWYRDVNGDDQPIGRDPVVNYTFTEPGNHIVHLTVRSSNNLTRGIFDGQDSISVNVAPKSANVVIYVNGKLLTTDDILRIGTQDAQKGILIDGTSTTPLGARTIVEYGRTITNPDIKYSYKKSGEGNPGQFVHLFPRNGIYQLQLDMIDNESNRIQERFQISVSDPVASIKFKPNDGSTSDMYTFDASASYSVTSRVQKYQREITDPEGEKIDILETKELKRKFTIPGTYTVKLTVQDALGNTSYDTEQFYVGSTEPVPSFTIKSVTDLLYPSEFLLDAGGTFDEDILNGNDKLTYNWSFAPSDNVKFVELEGEAQKIMATFDEPGTYLVKLLVQDAYGEIAQIEKNIEVESSLRPSMEVLPAVSFRGDEIEFIGATNKPVAFYEWNFGDGKVQKSNDTSVTHTYDKAGIYDVSLTVTTRQGETNTVTKQLFMGQQDFPIAAYQVKGQQNTILQPVSSCENASGDMVDAYYIDRYENIVFDAALSANTQGTPADLAVTIQPKNDEVYTKRSLNYNFTEIGCSYIDLYVEDTNVGKTSKQRVWFDVQNALPIIQNVVLEFPQPGGGNNVGVGAATAQIQDREIFSNTGIDPIVVKVQAKGTRDPDGFISHYAWYYYESNNPENIISLKITPADIPTTTFVVPKPHTDKEYAFGVRLVDNDGGEITSEELLGKGPIIFFPPGENKFDVPLITLTSNISQAKVGEEITFSTDSEVLSRKPDFESSRYFKYDFDGDGEYDMTTKKTTVRHRYEKPGPFSPKVAIFYKGRVGIDNADTITIQKGLKPLLLTTTHDKKVFIQDVSRGDIEERTICMDIRQCRADETWIIKNEPFIEFDYEEYGDYFIQFDVVDTFGNEQSIREKISLSETTEPLGIVSIPEKVKNDEGQREINVGNSLNNEVTFHIVSSSNCYIDLDITEDTDEDGDPTNDEDLACNETAIIPFAPIDNQQIARVVYVGDGKKKQEDIVVNFLDYEESINEEFSRAYDDLNRLIKDIPSNPDDRVLGFYRDLLINLKKSLGESDEMNSTIIQLRDLLENNQYMVDETHRDDALILLKSLSDTTVSSVYGGSEYDTAKTNVAVWFTDEAQEQVKELFRTFESQQGDQTAMKATLDEVFKLAATQRDTGNIDAVDFAYIQKNLCDIIVYYELPSKTCGTEVEIDPELLEEAEDEAGAGSGSSETSSLSSRIIRIVIIVVVVLLLIFGVLVVLFALKAKRQRAMEDEDEEEDEVEIESDASDETEE